MDTQPEPVRKIDGSDRYYVIGAVAIIPSVLILGALAHLGMTNMWHVSLLMAVAFALMVAVAIAYHRYEARRVKKCREPREVNREHLPRGAVFVGLSFVVFVATVWIGTLLGWDHDLSSFIREAEVRFAFPLKIVLILIFAIATIVWQIANWLGLTAYRLSFWLLLLPIPAGIGFLALAGWSYCTGDTSAIAAGSIMCA